MASSTNAEHCVERFAVKAVCAAHLLENLTVSAQQLEKIKAKVDRYIRQAQLIITWKRGSGLVKMFGSTAKTIGGVLVVAAPLHPKLSMAVQAGHRLWKLGAGIKILNAVGSMLREFWGNGCRTALTQFAECAAIFSQNAGVLHEVIQDLQVTSQDLNQHGLSSASQLSRVLSDFIPQDQAHFVLHVLHIVLGNQQYSPLFDFMALTSDPGGQSNLLQVMREVESFNFCSFAEESDSKSLVAIASFLHVTRELIDFLDGFHKVTDKDCKFLQECLSKISQESLSIMKVVVLLSNLSKIKMDDSAAKESVMHVENNQVTENRHLPISVSECNPNEEIITIDSLQNSQCEMNSINVSTIEGAHNSHETESKSRNTNSVNQINLPNIETGVEHDVNEDTIMECEKDSEKIVHRNIKNLFLADSSISKAMSNAMSIIGSGPSHILTAMRHRGGKEKLGTEGLSQFSPDGLANNKL